MSYSVLCSDALDALRGMEAESFDSLVTDPPAGIEFMGKDWDSFRGDRRQPTDETFHNSQSGPHILAKVRFGTSAGYGNQSVRGNFIASMRDVFSECLRVLKPGAHGLVWALPRTSHWTATALEDAGFEVRDCIVHLFGSGFPKSRNIGNGWGTALKPGSEHWILVRKPLSEKNVAENVQRWGTGAINIDGCRIGTTKEVPGSPAQRNRGSADSWGFGAKDGTNDGANPNVGRWPANVVLSHTIFCERIGTRTIKGTPRRDHRDENHGIFDGRKSKRDDEHPGFENEQVEVWECSTDCPVRMLDQQSGQLTSGKPAGIRKATIGYNGGGHETELTGYGDSGGASRFYFVAKPSSAEKHEALRSLSLFDSDPKSKPIKNAHPTVKPVDLMRHFVRMVTPEGGKVLDCFGGSGTTGIAAILEGCDVVLIEREPDYAATASARMERAKLESAA